ncbi:MAG: hypothetical protein ACJ76S_06890 [Solirubrobacteraceae bacterium]
METDAGRRKPEEPGRADQQSRPPDPDSDVEQVESGQKADTGSMSEEVERAGEREADASEG